MKKEKRRTKRKNDHREQFICAFGSDMITIRTVFTEVPDE